MKTRDVSCFCRAATAGTFLTIAGPRSVPQSRSSVSVTLMPQERLRAQWLSVGARSTFPRRCTAPPQTPQVHQGSPTASPLDSRPGSSIRRPCMPGARRTRPRWTRSGVDGCVEAGCSWPRGATCDEANLGVGGRLPSGASGLPELSGEACNGLKFAFAVQSTGETLCWNPAASCLFAAGRVVYGGILPREPVSTRTGTRIPAVTSLIPTVVPTVSKPLTLSLNP